MPFVQVFFAEEGQAQQQQLATQPFWGGASALFAFASREERERAVAALTAQAALGTALPGGKQAAAACTAILEVRLWESGGHACLPSAAVCCLPIPCSCLLYL